MGPGAAYTVPYSNLSNAWHERDNVNVVNGVAKSRCHDAKHSSDCDNVCTEKKQNKDYRRAIIIITKNQEK